MADQQTQVISLPFPSGGIVTASAYGAQPDNTTLSALNVRTVDTISGRVRGGRRPGLAKACSIDLGGAVQAMTNVSVVSSGVSTTYLCAVCDGSVFLLKESGGSLITSGISITGETITRVIGRLGVAGRSQQVYIADAVPKVLDVATGVVSLWAATSGTTPQGHSIVCRYRDRMVLAGGDHIVYLSRNGDPLDWNYHKLPIDQGAAIAVTLALPGEISQNVTAVMQGEGDWIVAATSSSLWMISGDPAAGGSIRRIKDDIGVIGQSAWCALPGGAIAFLSLEGLCVMSPDGQVSRVSRQKMPLRLRDIATSSFISLAYDVENSGVYLSVTPAAGDGEHWWIEADGWAFWENSYTGDLQPTALIADRQTIGTRRLTLFGCRDGYIRYMSDAAADDDGTAFTGYVYYGPFRMGSEFDNVMLHQVAATFGATSAATTLTLYGGDCSEDAVVSPFSLLELACTPGRNLISTARLTAGAFAAKVSGAGIWTIEAVAAKALVTGMQR